jgi:hypothetical protein
MTPSILPKTSATREKKYKIGDIIRFLNFEFETYNGYLQGKNRKHSSWKLHHGDIPNNEPYFHSVEMKEKTTQAHVKTLQDLRSWAQGFFSTNPLTQLDWYSLERQLANASTVQSFDLLLQISTIVLPEDPKNETMILTFLDPTHKKYRLYAPRMYHWSVKVGDIVKVRSVERIENDILVPHSKYHGVLVLPAWCKDVSDFKETEKSCIEKLPELKKEHIHPGFDLEFFKSGGTVVEGGALLSSKVAEDWYQL